MSPDGAFAPFVVHYAETFIVPAAVGPYTIRRTPAPAAPLRDRQGLRPGNALQRQLSAPGARQTSFTRPATEHAFRQLNTHTTALRRPADPIATALHPLARVDTLSERLVTIPNQGQGSSSEVTTHGRSRHRRVTAAALLLTGCSGGGNSATTRGHDRHARFLHRQGGLGAGLRRAERHERGGRRHHAEHDRLLGCCAVRRVHQAVVPHPEEPGLFTWHTGDSLKQLVDEGLVAETTDLWTQAIDEGWATEGLRDEYTFDGKQYCVPMNIAYWVMYYNANIFEEHGIDEPTTWEELDAAATTLKAAGITPYYQTSILFPFQWFQQLVAGTDPELYKGLSTGDVKYTDPEIVDIMNIWLDEHEQGWFSDAGSTVRPRGRPQAGRLRDHQLRLVLQRLARWRRHGLG